MHNAAELKRVRLLRRIDDHRALIMLTVLFAVLSVTASNFLNVYNVTTILEAATLNGIVAIGFTVVFILGQLDLSIGAVVMFAGMLVIGLQPALGWVGAIPAAILAGVLIGAVNGLLVVKARINSFIVTLGMLTIVTSVMQIYSGGGSLSVNDFALADALDTAVVPMLPPNVIITLILVAGSSLFLTRTRPGRGFFVVGANPETAWLAGLNRDRYLIAGFIISGAMAAIGGTLFAIRLNSMTSAAILGTRTLMIVLSAAIIGGTLMSGGRGSVVKSYIAVLLLTTLFNGIGCFGLGFEIQMFVNGLILAVVVLYEAYVIHRNDLLRGRRPELIEELERMKNSNHG